MNEQQALDGPIRHGLPIMVGMLVLAIGCGVAAVLITGALGDRPVFMLALPLTIALVAWSIMNPEGLFLVLVLTRAMFNPVFDIARLPVFGGLGGLLNIVIIGLAVSMGVRGKHKVPLAVWRMWVPFLLIVAIGVVRAPDFFSAQRDGAVFVTYGAVYYGAFFVVRDERRLDAMLRWLLLSGIPVFFYSIVSDIGLGRTPDGRLNGPFAHPNILAFYCVVMLGAWLAKVRSSPTAPLFNLRAIGWWIYLLAWGLLLAGTQSRGGWVGALILFTAYAVFVRPSYLVVVAAAAVAAAVVPEIRDRIVDLASNNEVTTYGTLNSYAWRQYLWRSAIGDMSPLAYLIGNGIGAFAFRSVFFFPLAGGVNWGAHNVYMQLLYDNGLLGVASFLFLFAVPAVDVWKKRGMNPTVRVTALGLIPAFAFMCYGDNMLAYSVVNWNFWFVTGLIASVALNASVSQAREESRIEKSDHPQIGAIY